MKPQIGIIGAGMIGGTLGVQLVKAGYEVRLGLRDPESSAKAQKAIENDTTGNLRLATIDVAVANADVVILAVPGAAVADAVESLKDFKGVIIDTTNKVKLEVPGGHSSLAAFIQAKCPQAQVVKAFNTIPFLHIANPDFGGGVHVQVPIAGEEKALLIASTLIEAIGLVPIKCGGLGMAEHIEHLALLWISMAFQGGHGSDWFFGKIEKPAA